MLRPNRPGVEIYSSSQWGLNAAKNKPSYHRTSRGADFHLRDQRRHEPAHPFPPRPARMASRAARPQREWPHHRRHLRAPAQEPPGVAQELRATFEVSRTARSRPLHHEASRRCAQEECGAVPQNARGRSIDGPQAARHEIFARQLDANLARERHHVRVHVLPRSTSSRANPDARAPAWLSPAGQNPRGLALGETVERSRPLNSMFRRYNSNPCVPRTQLGPSENRSLEERGCKDGDRGGSARTQGIHRKEEKKRL